MSSHTENGINFKDIASLMFTVYGLYQQRNLHQIELRAAKDRHKVSIDHSQKLTDRSLNEVKRFYLLELFNNLQQHFQQLNADLIASCKEAERDMFDQRNQSLQTIILSSSVMFGALSTAIVNGTLADDTEDQVIWVFGVSSAISFGALFISIVLCIETVIRASLFMYRRAQTHTRHLQEAIESTRDIMLQMRNKTQDSLKPENVKKIAEMSYEQLEEEWKNHEMIIHKYLVHRMAINHKFAEFRKDKRHRATAQQQTASRREAAADTVFPSDPSSGDLSLSPPPPLEEQERKRRTLVQAICACLCCCFLSSEDMEEGDGRSRRSRTSSSFSSSSCLFRILLAPYQRIRTRYREDIEDAVIEMTFNEFWEKKCQIYATWAFGLFYVGTATLLVAISLYLYSKFRYQYQIFIGAVLSAVVIGVVVIFGIFLAGRMRITTRNYNLNLKRDPVAVYPYPPPQDVEQGLGFDRSAISQENIQHED